MSCADPGRGRPPRDRAVRGRAYTPAEVGARRHGFRPACVPQLRRSRPGHVRACGGIRGGRLFVARAAGARTRRTCLPRRLVAGPRRSSLRPLAANESATVHRCRPIGAQPLRQRKCTGAAQQQQSAQQRSSALLWSIGQDIRTGRQDAVAPARSSVPSAWRAKRPAAARVDRRHRSARASRRSGCAGSPRTPAGSRPRCSSRTARAGRPARRSGGPAARAPRRRRPGRRRAAATSASTTTPVSLQATRSAIDDSAALEEVQHPVPCRRRRRRQRDQRARRRAQVPDGDVRVGPARPTSAGGGAGGVASPSAPGDDGHLGVAPVGVAVTHVARDVVRPRTS